MDQKNIFSSIRETTFLTNYGDEYDKRSDKNEKPSLKCQRNIIPHEYRYKLFQVELRCREILAFR
jgi:hypothetical protein